ncbi:hypothetical protein AB1I58_08490 [Enterococcus hirae]
MEQSTSKKDPQKKLRSSMRRLSRSTESLQRTHKKLTPNFEGIFF